MKKQIEAHNNYIIAEQFDMLNKWMEAGKEIEDLTKTFKWRILQFTLWWNELLIKILNASK